MDTDDQDYGGSLEEGKGSRGPLPTETMAVAVLLQPPVESPTRDRQGQTKALHKGALWH